MSKADRQSTGNPTLDEALGGGLLPGTLTLVIGATGVGKTQLGLQWCLNAVGADSGRGAIIDLSSRGDSQSHDLYAHRLLKRQLVIQPMERVSTDAIFSAQQPLGDQLALIGYEGRRVMRSQLDADQWDAWQSKLNREMPAVVEFVYRHLIRGTRRFMIDGIEPQDDPYDNLQMDLLEMIYHRMLRQEHDWLARELFRQDFRHLSDRVAAHPYPHDEASAVALVTTRESMLNDLITKPLSVGDFAAGANTIILMGRIVEQGKLARGLYIAKHRGSACSDSILQFRIHDQGLEIEAGA